VQFKLAVQHGESWAKIQALSGGELNQRLVDEGLEMTGSIEDRQLRLWEYTLPVYPIPARMPTAARMVFAAVLDEEYQPRPEGADRDALVEALQEIGYPDEAAANQAIDQQIENLILYYGYRRAPSSADVIIMEKR